jgi:hypothetical protein
MFKDSWNFFQVLSQGLVIEWNVSCVNKWQGISKNQNTHFNKHFETPCLLFVQSFVLIFFIMEEKKGRI